MIKLGSNGDVVKQIQQKLGISADGNFGPGTEKSVKEWQTKNGLTADGIVGSSTLEKMGINSSSFTNIRRSCKIFRGINHAWQFTDGGG